MKFQLLIPSNLIDFDFGPMRFGSPSWLEEDALIQKFYTEYIKDYHRVSFPIPKFNAFDKSTFKLKKRGFDISCGLDKLNSYLVVSPIVFKILQDCKTSPYKAFFNIKMKNKEEERSDFVILYFYESILKKVNPRLSSFKPDEEGFLPLELENLYNMENEELCRIMRNHIKSSNIAKYLHTLFIESAESYDLFYFHELDFRRPYVSDTFLKKLKDDNINYLDIGPSYIHGNSNNLTFHF